MSLQQAITEFRGQFRGAVIEPEDAAYDEARKVYNGMIDRRPRLIAKCTDVADVMAAVRMAKANGLRVSIRGGGHNAAGLGVCDDGMVIDLAPINYVRVDPSSRTVLVGAGCKWSDVDHATHAFGLAVPSGIISSTGVARADAGRRNGTPDAEVRADDRQPALGRYGAGRRQLRGRERRGESGPVLGGARRRRKLRHRDLVPV